MSAASAADSQNHLAGQIVSVQGKVLIRTESKTSSVSRQLKVGDKLFEGDVINTPSDGTAKILLQDKTILDIGSSALFNVDKFKVNQGGNRDVELGMMYGTLRANVTQKLAAAGKFKIRTPSATMGVRGTEFMVKTALSDNTGKADHSNNGNHYGQNKDKEKDKNKTSTPTTEVVVLQGKVEVAQQSTKPEGGSGAGTKVDAPVVALTAGQKLVADSSAAVPAVPVQLTMDQARASVGSATIVDNTFKTAVTLDLSTVSGAGGESRGPASDGGVSNVTANLVHDTVVSVTAEATQTFAEGPAPMPDVPGAFNPGDQDTGVQLIAGGLRRVTVRIFR